jgi:ATP synthase protein I
MTPWREYGRYGSVGLELVLSVIVGYLGGRWLDVHFGAHGWLTGIGFVLGTIAGFRSIVLAAHRMGREFGDDDRKDKAARPPSTSTNETHEPGTHHDDGRPDD